MRIPELIETWKIARAIGWPTEKTRLFLEEAGIATRPAGCKHNFIVIREDFEVAMPRIYEIFVRKYEAGEISTKRHRGRRVKESCPVANKNNSD